MAKERRVDWNVDPFKQSVPEAREIRANGARAPRGVNAHAVANAQFIDRKKTEIRYKNGKTLSTRQRSSWPTRAAGICSTRASFRTTWSKQGRPVLTMWQRITDGALLTWRKRPRLQRSDDKLKKPKPLGDLAPFLPGSLVLSEKAHKALSPFLSTFGQLLPLDVDGITHWFYDVTHVVSCIDRDRSEQRAGGTIGAEASIEASLPVEAAVFKDPLTARARIYVNELGKQALEDAAERAGIRGLKFLRAGMAEQEA